MNPDIWPQLKSEIHNKFVAYEYVDATDPTLSEFIVGLMRVGKSPQELSSELQLLVGSDYDSNVTQWFYDRKKALENPETARVEEPKVEQPSSPEIVTDVPREDKNEATRARINRDDRMFSRALGSALNPNKTTRRSPPRHHRSRSRSPESNSSRVIHRGDRYTHEEKRPSRIQSRIGSTSNSTGRVSVFDRLGTVNTAVAPMEEETKTERCKYWPTCKNGEECAFFHPDTVCSEFPNCPNKANECMFIHPETAKAPVVAQPIAKLPYPCKFFPYCSNPVCPYIHPQHNFYMQAQPSFDTNRRVPIPCKNGNECTRPNCHFLHPKDENPYTETICKFDGACTRPNCFYKHTMENTRNKTFINKLENTNNRQFSVPEDQVEERIIVGESADTIKPAQQQNTTSEVSGMELDGDAVTDAKS